MSTTPAPRNRVITRQVVEWAAWDWGSAAFNAVATTFVFTTYLTSDGVFTDAGTASSWLSNGMTIAGLFIALLAPITGQRADRRGRGGVWLGWFTGAVVACMLAMYFVHPESVLGPKGALMLGIALLGLGNVFFEFASVNYNAMLNHLGEKEDRGKISGFGWAAGYIGGIVLLLILYVGLIGVNLLGVPTDEPFDFNFDCATSITQNGKFEYYERIGEEVHPGTVIGEDGGMLSQGQKQLLCITRVMLCLPPMLILDEATSSIDTRTELKIQEAFAKMMLGRTSFIVAHRLSTIQSADVILVMKDGHVIEQGNHESLLAKGGFYATLYQSQFAQ